MLREARNDRAGSAVMDAAPVESVIFYCRPGCGFCAVLRRRLRHAGLAVIEVNIWEDPAAAAFVRSVAGGNETVPTVVVGRRALVNPAARQVLDAVRAEAPHLPPATLPSRPRACRWWWRTKPR